MRTQLREATISLNDLFLDPNNPRFADIAESARPVREDRVHEDSVQESALGKMSSERFDITSLKDSIRTIGFLPVDRLVVVELPQREKYMVVEGNRRLAALKSLIREEEAGEADLPAEIRDSVVSVPVLVIDDSDRTARDHTARILQGVRHVASVRAWGPYQQGQLIAIMLEDGKTLREIKEVLGLSTQRINMLRRSYFALIQMRDDPDYGEFAKPKLFSHFDEALKQPELRRWLEWDDEVNKCLNEQNRQLFYAWSVGIEDEGERLAAKITDAKDCRHLPAIIGDPVQFRRFCTDLRLTVADALRSVPSREQQIDWRGILGSNLNTLAQVPAMALTEANDSDIQLLQRLKSTCDVLIGQIEHARAQSANRG